MKIIVVADTHMPRMAKKLPDRLLWELRDADTVIHAGDWTQLSIYEELAAHAPTVGVAGNNDGPGIIKLFGYRKQLEFEGHQIGIVHGHGTGKRINTEQRALDSFKGTSVDVILFGHSHIPLQKRVGSVLLFNPGSPTDKRRQPRYSFGVLQLNPGAIKAEHIFYDDKS
ncbi:metallophosphoesterase family protein [Paenibacillus mendelii]|uniref:Phosphoesterase n=1 Tax=Paenibacillus mendelii TaxID=206163 RepID=A0ABV6J5Y8_9BACL|nr:metallophosphoesterase [Paenibacillus mendelii]MCQ6560096.1 metallophosphoesterase [Paenibacillus mendelii]